MIIADTNVVSEFMKDQPHAGVLSWAREIDPGDLTICVITVEEIERRLGLLPPGRRRRELLLRWNRLIDSFAEAIVEYDLPAARETARILVAARSAGRTMALADAQIAGICVAAGYVLATRNVRDFSCAPEVTVINPFG